MGMREKIIVKLLVFLIEFIGKKVENFYAYKLDEIVKGIEEKE